MIMPSLVMSSSGGGSSDQQGRMDRRRIVHVDDVIVEHPDRQGRAAQTIVMSYYATLAAV